MGIYTPFFFSLLLGYTNCRNSYWLVATVLFFWNTKPYQATSTSLFVRQLCIVAKLLDKDYAVEEFPSQDKVGVCAV